MYVAQDKHDKGKHATWFIFKFIKVNVRTQYLKLILYCLYYYFIFIIILL